MDLLGKIRANQDYKRLFENFISLSILQGLNYILPLITFPYLVRVLGVEKFGLLSFATATIGYFQIITDYGFNLSATREIAIHRENKEKVQEIFSAVMTIKFGLMLLSLILLILLVISFEKFRQDWEVYLLTFGMVVGNTLFPVWFFQGMERMKYITILNIIAKGVFTVAIFIFVKERSDYWKVPILNAFGFIVVGIVSLMIMKIKFSITLFFSKIKILKYYFSDGWAVFLSRIYVLMYTNLNIFLLGIFTNNVIVGYYSIAERIINAIGGLFQPFMQVIYPFLANLYHNSKKVLFYNYTKKITYYLIITSLLLFLLSIIFGKMIILTISGGFVYEIYIIYLILSFTIILSPFGPFYTQILLVMKKNYEFNKLVKYTFLFNLILSPIGIIEFKEVGLAVVVVFVQLFVVCLCIIKYLGAINE